MSGASPRRLFLAASITGSGTSPLAARWPGERATRFAEWEHFAGAARIARQGVLDAVFLSDFPAFTGSPEQGAGHVFDPVVLFSALAGAVPDIGFVLTASTSYNAPFNLARRTATLDAISGGRTILNLVTNFHPDVAANFGAEPQLARPDRYRKAAEFVDVLRALWGSWELDGEPGGPLWSERTARPIDHHGEFFDVRGPLNVPTGPQGHPVLSQAGASGDGLDFAARSAEMVYAAALSKELASRFRDELEQRLTAHGRAAEDVRLVPGVNVILGRTEEEAFARQLAFSGVPDEEALVAKFLAAHRVWGQPEVPERIDPDQPLDPEWFGPTPDQNKPIGFSTAVRDLVALEGLSARQLVRRYGDPGGHRLLVGSPKQVAAGLIDWWADGVVDGYVVHVPLLPGDLELFVRHVVPILQAEGVFPRDYEASGCTMRERLGLPVPSPSQEPS